MLTTSSMQLEVLKRLAYSSRYRGLVAAGIASVARSTTEAFDRASVKHFLALGRVAPLPEDGTGGVPVDKEALPEQARPFLDSAAVLPDGTTTNGGGMLGKREREE